MPAYSFGNKWMGIVALKDAPVMPPLHRLAEKFHKTSVGQGVFVGENRALTREEALHLLRGVGQRLALREEWSLVRECESAARRIYLGGRVRLWPWLRAELRKEVNGVPYGRPLALTHRRREWTPHLQAGICATIK